MNYQILSENNNHRLVAISDTEVGKLRAVPTYQWVNAVTGEEVSFFNMQMDVDAEIEKLVYANSINDLMVRFIRKDKFDDEYDMVVMERLYPIHYHSISLEKRKEYFEKFYHQISELHDKGFLHGDIQQPINDIAEVVFSNIVLTETGLRLIDTGFSMILKSEPNLRKYFERYYHELLEIKNFEEYFLSEEYS
jgi:serine/threonine protein kinase